VIAASETYEAEVAAIEAALRAIADPVRAASERRYLKSDLEFIGVGVPATRKLIRDFVREHEALDREHLIGLVAALWEQPVHEPRSVAIELLGMHKRLLEPGDIEVIERLLRQSLTWAYVDPLAIDVAGDLVARHPELNAVLDRWASDGDFWIRRASMLALLRPLRSGGGDFERFARYADAMLEEREFFIRKAIGWVLRESSKRRPELVYGWLAPRTQRASGVTMREAVKYLPAEQREALMQAYREHRAAK
jgi:3-methyladenine DNA glycosylase AlkD